MRVLLEVLKGWLYLLAYITGGNFVRKARLNLGKNVKIAPTAFFKFPENITIGDNTFINHLCSVWAAPNSKIIIGRDVMLGPNTVLVASNHGIAPGRPMREQDGVDQNIMIGDDVWIGANVSVLAGATIGSGCVIGAGAVVRGTLPPNSICVGVPARVIATR